MKILIFNWQDIRNPLGGGAEVHLHEIFSRVARRGHGVTLYCCRFPGAPHEERIDGIRIIREGGRNLFNFRVPFRYWSRFRHEGYDVVIDDMNKIPFFTPLFVKEPLVILIHHLFGTSIFREAALPAALYVTLAERAAVAVARGRQVPFFVVSQSTRREMIDRGIAPERISIVENCVDHERYRRGDVPRSASPLIGYFGRLKKYKSVDHLLRAFAIVRKSSPGVRLVVIGEGDARPGLEAAARQLGIDADVRFTGYVDEEEKVRLLQQVWFLVNTSSKEGWGLTVIESNACGTPVIGSDVPGLRDAIRDGETGMLYPYGDITRLTETMNLLLGDGDLRRRLSAAAAEWAATFNWDLVAERTIELLRQRIGAQTK